MSLNDRLPDDPATLARAGQRVVAYRLAHGTLRGRRRAPLTQIALAKRAGISVGCLQGFEMGTRVTRPDNARRIAAAIGLTLDALFSDEPATSAPPEPAAAPTPAIARELTPEELFVVRMFSIAVSEVRVRLKSELIAHLAQRRDRPAVELLRDVCASEGISGVEPPRVESQSPRLTAANGPPFPGAAIRNGTD